METTDRWYENATVYAVDVETFADGDAAFERVGRGEDAGDADRAGGTWRFELGRYGYCWVRVEEEH